MLCSSTRALCGATDAARGDPEISIRSKQRSTSLRARYGLSVRWHARDPLDDVARLLGDAGDRCLPATTTLFAPVQMFACSQRSVLQRSPDAFHRPLLPRRRKQAPIELTLVAQKRLSRYAAQLPADSNASTLSCVLRAIRSSMTGGLHWPTRR